MNKLFIGLDFGVRNIAISYIRVDYSDSISLDHHLTEIKLKENDKTEPAVKKIIETIKNIDWELETEIILFFENIDTFEVTGVNKFKIPTIKMFQALIDEFEFFKKHYHFQYATFNSSVIKMLQKRKYFARVFEAVKKKNQLKTLSSHAKDALILCYLAFDKWNATLFKYQKKVF